MFHLVHTTRWKKLSQTHNEEKRITNRTNNKRQKRKETYHLILHRKGLFRSTTGTAAILPTFITVVTWNNNTLIEFQRHIQERDEKEQTDQLHIIALRAEIYEYGLILPNKTGDRRKNILNDTSILYPPLARLLVLFFSLMRDKLTSSPSTS